MRKFRSLSKFLAVVLAIGMIACCMSACGGTETKETTEETEAEPPAQSAPPVADKSVMEDELYYTEAASKT